MKTSYRNPKVFKTVVSVATLALALVFSFFTERAHSASIADALGTIPIQNGGRVKPLDTFARESLQLIYGKTKFNGKPAIEILMTWYLIPESWDSIEIIKISRNDLKETLGLETGRSLFSPADLQEKMDRLQLLLVELESKRKAQEKLDPYFQAIATLENQYFTFQAIRVGKALTVVPPVEGNSWTSLDVAPEEVQKSFQQVAQAFVGSLKEGKTEELKQAVEAFKALLRARQPSEYPSDQRLAVEVHYNNLHPFLIAWGLYLLASLLFGAHLLSSPAKSSSDSGSAQPSRLRQASGWMVLLAFLVHTYGFGLRIFLTERPPVSNMYETVIWIPWGAVVFGFLVSRAVKNFSSIFAGAIVNSMCLILADFAPTVLDASIQPLQPVLRSNMWLTIHVLTITLSYAAFFVAFVLGDFGLVYVLRGETKFSAPVKQLSQSAYRCVQIGVVLLAAGTILGGVWADYSWGRFWGWDPKETWALIALLGYIAVLHGRLAGWLRDVGFLVGSVVAFSLVIMAWYGVNYVLGAGLHSYGFGGGGVAQVSAFVGAHILFVVFVLLSRRRVEA